MRRLVLVFVAVLVAAPAVLAGQDARATLEADVTEATVGDRIGVTIRVEHARDETVAWPDSLSLAPFEVLEAAAVPARPEGDRAVSTVNLAVAAFELGDLEIPSLELTVVDSAGSETVVRTDPFVVGIVSVGLDEGGDIRDVKGPIGIPRNWLLLWPWLLAALAVAGAAYWYARRRGRDGPEPAFEPEIPAHEAALAALERLEASNLLERGQVKDFHISVSQILREYVEGRFRIDALEMTSGELIAALGTADLGDELIGETRRFLDACDLVKFAKRRPSEAESRGLIPVARRFVDETRPPEPRPAPAEEAA